MKIRNSGICWLKSSPRPAPLAHCPVRPGFVRMNTQEKIKTAIAVENLRDAASFVYRSAKSVDPDNAADLSAMEQDLLSLAQELEDAIGGE